jgi:hypothetical protein
MKKIEFSIDNKKVSVNIAEETQFIFGKSEVLSNSETDITYNQSWYNLGYAVFQFLKQEEFENLVNGIKVSIIKFIKEELMADVSDFSLEDYHHYIKTNADHAKITGRTRDLFPQDFNFQIKELIPRFEEFLGFELSDIDPDSKMQVHIILRINRPNSNDYNPPHKDIYEGVDNENTIPKFMNFWIPICGVTSNSSLPLAPGSHLIEESKIFRTTNGANIEGNKYRVRLVKEWNKSNSLKRVEIKNREVLVFSSHLIHGLAINSENNKTRIALEFRLFKK